jgi:uncharacterized membrane protein YhiD involved in acid resistance
MSIFIFSSRFALALVLGALIGLERQWRHRMAGTRTHAWWQEARQRSQWLAR